MSGFYNQRPYVGSIAKKPRLGPRGPHTVPGQPHGDEGGKRLMSFKEFILSQHNDITEQEALARYSDYKTDFTRKQIDKFFKEHSEEEWFRNKYRPPEISKLDEANKASKMKRKEVYKQMAEKNLIDGISVDYHHSEKLSHFLNNFALLLEGATIEDIENEDACNSFAVSTIYIPELHQLIDKSMLVKFAESHPGFLRVAMSEAQPDKNFMRRAWITYKQMDTNSLRNLSWAYNSHIFNGQTVKALIHCREMDKRSKCTRFWFCHKDAAKSDLKNIAKLLTHFEGEDCPLLDNIKDHLIEEANEEEQLLGVSGQSVADFEFIQDPVLFEALDRAILYLRVVHSFDYYASVEYVGEDDMPQKVGFMFSRPNPPETYGVEDPRRTLDEFIDAHKAQIDSFLDKPSISEIEQKLLGKKNPEEEVENFIYQQTLEKKPGEKYVCKLTKKRFTSPEFVRKHIFNRCGHNLDEVRTEVEFFNNYVADPKRPM